MHYNTRRYHKRTAEMRHILGDKCINCGTLTNLHIHHMKGKLFSLSVEFDKPWKLLLDELQKCKLLCRQCHKDVHKAKHGTLGRYSHYKCRCILCKNAWNSWHIKYKQQRRASIYGDAQVL